jgi:hypothetical protein
MNRPYVKQYVGVGEDRELLNPINGYFPSKRSSKAFPNGFPNRKERRDVLENEKRLFSNKKGTQLVVTRIGRNVFTKYKRVFQKIGNKRIIHFVEA